MKSSVKLAQQKLFEQLEDDIDMGAGVFPVALNTGRFLLNLRSSEVSNPLTFASWGGHIDEDDAGPEQAALRELEEEAGYVEGIELIEAHTSVSDEFVYFNFLGLVDDEFTPELSWESEDFQWVTYSELVSLKSELHPKFRIFVAESRDLLQQFVS